MNWWPVIDQVEDGRGYTSCDTSYFPFCRSTDQATAAREPGAVLLFAGVAHLTEESFRAAALVQVALNLVILLGVFLLARQLLGAGVALFAALLWALYLPASQSEVVQVTGNPLATACLIWGVFLFVHARRTNRARDWLLAGGCLGLAALTRSAVAALALALAFGLLIATRPQTRREQGWLRRWLQPAALLVLAFGLVISPWVARNEATFGQPVLGTTLTGYDLYRENAPLATGHYTHFVAGKEATAAVADLLARRTDLTGRENEAEMDAVYRGEALRIIRAHPGRYLMASLARLPMLWFDWSVPLAYGYRYSIGNYLVMLQQALLLLMAFIGAWSLRGRGWPLVAGVVALTLVYLPVIGRLYLIFPVMPLVVILAAAGCAAASRAALARFRPARAGNMGHVTEPISLSPIGRGALMAS